MPSALPDGEPAPADGRLPDTALAGAASRRLGVYLHVPFCAVRCGYCDFNTYTPAELGSDASPVSFVQAAVAEVALAARVLASGDDSGAGRTVGTVFLGGGTPTLLDPDQLAVLLSAVRRELGLATDAEVTTEANPDSVDPDSLRRLRAAGFNRISFGMQSAVPRVLATLDRTHDPERVPQAVAWAREAGFDQVSVDLIYGTPGETLEDWRRSIEAALAMRPDHVSAYALIVEDGTALSRQVRRGELPAPDDDDLADKYTLADELLSEAGMEWYELSNWAREDRARCRHNEVYWTGGDWWGIGPGAHSHVGGVRWWNVKHPAAYARQLADGASPALAREVLDADTRRFERVLLETRLREGLSTTVLDGVGRKAAERAADDDLVDRTALDRDRVRLTLRGRLLADAVVRDLLG